MIYLASQSPRRMELLQQINIEYCTLPVVIDESLLRGEMAEVYVRRMAVEKAKAGQSMLPVSEQEQLVLAADTIVRFEGEIMGKPKSKEDGLNMLTKLSGKVHQVLTAVALCRLEQVLWALSVSDVHFRKMSKQEIELYWETGEPIDKAGAYAVQGLGAKFIKEIHGSYSGIMGLPIYETSQLLAKV